MIWRTLFFTYGFGRLFVSGLQGAGIEAGKVAAALRREKVQVLEEEVGNARILDRF